MTQTLRTQPLYPHHAHVIGREEQKNSPWLPRVKQEMLLKRKASLTIHHRQVIGQNLFHSFHYQHLNLLCKVSYTYPDLWINNLLEKVIKIITITVTTTTIVLIIIISSSSSNSSVVNILLSMMLCLGCYN